MKITIDTSNLSELDLAMLAFLADQGEAAEDEPKEAPTPAPVKKKKTAAKKTTKKAEPEPEVEEDGDAPTMSDAVAAATQLVSSGGSAKVKAALAEVGAKRVSEMKEEDIPAFLTALEDES